MQKLEIRYLGTQSATTFNVNKIAQKTPILKICFIPDKLQNGQSKEHLNIILYNTNSIKPYFKAVIPMKQELLPSKDNMIYNMQSTQ